MSRLPCSIIASMERHGGSAHRSSTGGYLFRSSTVYSPRLVGSVTARAALTFGSSGATVPGSPGQAERRHILNMLQRMGSHIQNIYMPSFVSTKSNTACIDPPTSLPGLFKHLGGMVCGSVGVGEWLLAWPRPSV